MTVRIITGDCRLRLREIEHVDAVITDPVWPNCPAGLLDGWNRSETLFAETLALLPASVKRLVVILRSDSDPRFLRAVPDRWPFVCMQTMSYAMPGYLGRILGGNEVAYGFGTPIPSRDGKRVIPMRGPTVTSSKASRDTGHPCSRSIQHMTWLVDWWSERGDVVLDPFCGAGTIPLAADHMQRHGIGIEINPEYVTLAEARIRNDAPLFAEAVRVEAVR